MIKKPFVQKNKFICFTKRMSWHYRRKRFWKKYISKTAGGTGIFWWKEISYLMKYHIKISIKSNYQPIHRKIQLVFQNAFGTDKSQIYSREVLTEPLKYTIKKKLHTMKWKNVPKFLEKVGLNPEFMCHKKPLN